jgi:hypothetical protein
MSFFICGGSRNRTYVVGFGDRRPTIERYPQYSQFNTDLKNAPVPLRTSAFSDLILLSADSCLFVDRFHTTPTAKLLEFDLSLHQLLIFIGVIITPLTNGATHSDKSVGVFNFGHGNDDTILLLKLQRVTTGFSRSRILTNLSRWPELNRRPTPYHGVALPAELQRQRT